VGGERTVASVRRSLRRRRPSPAHPGVGTVRPGARPPKTLKATFEKDRFGQHITLPVEQDAEKRIVGLRSLLAKPHLQEAEAEYQRLKNPPFYALWGGPRNLEQLALRLNRGGQYEFLYRLWSATAHSEDLQRQLGSRDGSAAVMRGFRRGTTEALVNATSRSQGDSKPPRTAPACLAPAV
jgi:hypothetical protein